MINKLIFSLGCMIAVSATAQTAGTWQTIDATVCKTAPSANVSVGFSDTVEFTCGNKEKGTIPSLAKKGWHIVSISPHVDMNLQTGVALNFTVMVLEKIAK